MIVHKILKYTLIILSVIGGIFFLTLVGGEGLGVIEPFLILGYVVFFIALAFTLFFLFTDLASDPARLKRALISMGLFAVIIIFSYLISSGEAMFKQGVEVASANVVKWIDTGLKVLYIVGTLSLLSVVYSIIRRG